MNQFLDTATRQELQNLLKSAQIEQERQIVGRAEFESLAFNCQLAVNSLDRQIDALSALLREDETV